MPRDSDLRQIQEPAGNPGELTLSEWSLVHGCYLAFELVYEFHPSPLRWHQCPEKHCREYARDSTSGQTEKTPGCTFPDCCQSCPSRKASEKFERTVTVPPQRRLANCGPRICSIFESRHAKCLSKYLISDQNCGECRPPAQMLRARIWKWWGMKPHRVYRRAACHFITPFQNEPRGKQFALPPYGPWPSDRL